MKKTVKIDLKTENLIVVFLSVLLLLSIFSIYSVYIINSTVNKKVLETKEETRPANLEIIAITDSSCEDCFDINQLISFIKLANVNTTVSNIDFSSSLGKKLVNDFKIQKLPVLLISGEITKSSVNTLWNQLGGIVSDDTVVIPSIPPYRNVTSNKIEGLVNLIMLTDNSCSTCYNVTTHKLILARYGVKVKTDSTYDINSTDGIAYKSKYNITKVPTIIFSPDASVYTALVQIWQQVGTKEIDGWFVFRATDQMGTYKDLTTGNITSTG